VTIVIYNATPQVPTVTSALTATGAVAQSFAYAIAATNYPTGYFAIGLPPGLSFDPVSGNIFGTPRLAGTYTVTIRATNRGGTGSATLTLTINPDLRPRFQTILKSTGFDMSFLTLTDKLYEVEWVNDLLGTNNWVELVSGIQGDGTLHTVTDELTNNPARFYRIKVQ
jgi:hypothetical protein